jgi:hypothetical protein
LSGWANNLRRDDMAICEVCGNDYDKRSRW